MIAQPLDKSNLIEPISHKLFPTYPSDIFQAKFHRYDHYVLWVWWISDHAEYGY